MRNPRRWRAIALAALPLGALLILVANRQQSQAIGAAFGLPGLCAVFAGLVVGWQAHRAARAQARLAGGEGVLARWRIDAAGWRAFLEHERALGKHEGSLPNEAALPGDVPAEGVEIVVGEDAVTIGESVHVLPRHGAPEVIAADLHALGAAGTHVAELQLRHPPSPRSSGGMNPPVYARLAFPLPDSAWRDARKAIGFYARGRPGKASFFHGRGDGSDPEDLSTCSRCGHRTHVYRSTCPECGGSMLSKRWARRFGAVLIVLGGALAAGMTVLLVKLSPMLAHPGVEYDGTRFNGTHAQALGIWAVLAAVLVFGATALGAGASQVATGKRNMRVAWILSGIFGMLVAVAALLPGD